MEVLVNIWPFIYLIVLISIPILLALICYRLFRKSAEKRKIERLYNNGQPLSRERVEQMNDEERKEILLLLLKL